MAMKKHRQPHRRAMAKKGTYNESFFGSFPMRIHGTPIRFGLLVGTAAEDDRLRDVAFAAATPPQLNEDGQPSAPPKDSAALHKQLESSVFVAWARQHADAVRRLLPGGLEPCGCFAVVQGDGKSLAPALAALLRGISEPLVLTIDESTRKLSFWQYSATAKPPMRPATMKADSHKDSLLLWSSMVLDVLLPISEEDGVLDADALASEAESLAGDALGRCRLGVASASTPMTLVDNTSEAAINTLIPKDCKELRLAFLRGGSGVIALPNPDGKPCIRQRCLMIGTSLVIRRGEELRRAVEVLKKAMAASLGHRLQLALDEGDGSFKGRLQLPWRALCRPEGVDLPFWCGDYCMPDEDMSAARERLGQLLGVPEAAFEEAPVHMQENKRLAQNHAGTYGAPEQDQQQPSKAAKAAGGTALPAAACALAVAAAVLAAAVPLLLRS